MEVLLIGTRHLRRCSLLLYHTMLRLAPASNVHTFKLFSLFGFFSFFISPFLSPSFSFSLFTLRCCRFIRQKDYTCERGPRMTCACTCFYGGVNHVSVKWHGSGGSSTEGCKDVGYSCKASCLNEGRTKSPCNADYESSTCACKSSHSHH